LFPVVGRSPEPPDAKLMPVLIRRMALAFDRYRKGGGLAAKPSC
jgi:hypothetical protein